MQFQQSFKEVVSFVPARVFFFFFGCVNVAKRGVAVVVRERGVEGGEGGAVDTESDRPTDGKGEAVGGQGRERKKQTNKHPSAPSTRRENNEAARGNPR